MSKSTLTRIVNPESNGNGGKPYAVSTVHTITSTHGGVADGLPVAVPNHVDDAGAAQHADGSSHGNGYDARNSYGNGNTNGASHTPETQISNGSGAGWTAAKLPFTPEPDVELSHSGSEAMAPLTAVLESLLFVAGEAVDISVLAKALQLKPEQVRDGLVRLAQQCKTRAGGLRLQVHNDRYQLVTAPATAPFVEDFLNIDVSTKLSSAALETLAIVAYRQPVTRVQIENIRGVDCSGVLRSLVVRGLIEEAGRLDAVGRPIVYGVTELFMQHFGLAELADLPPLGHEDADMLHAASALADASPLSDASPGSDVSSNGSVSLHTGVASSNENSVTTNGNRSPGASSQIAGAVHDAGVLPS